MKRNHRIKEGKKMFENLFLSVEETYDPIKTSKVDNQSRDQGILDNDMDNFLGIYDKPSMSYFTIYISRSLWLYLFCIDVTRNQIDSSPHSSEVGMKT